MTASLHCIREQKRLPYRPLPDEVTSLYKAINKHVFDNAHHRRPKKDIQSQETSQFPSDHELAEQE